METKVEKPTMERIGRKMFFNNIFVVPRPLRGGGLALSWKDELLVDVQTYLNRHIEAIINRGVEDA